MRTNRGGECSRVGPVCSPVRIPLDLRSSVRDACSTVRESLWSMGADALSDVLRAVKLTGAVFVTVDVSPPWSAPVPSAATLRSIIMPSVQHLISYHLVTAGGCWAIPHQGKPIRLDPGDVVVFPGGDPHVMCTDPKVPRGAGFDMRRIRPA